VAPNNRASPCAGTSAGQFQPTSLLGDTDNVLQAARRVDWRFLLPSPDLQDVLYVGQDTGSLVQSLRLLSGSLTVVADVRDLDAIDEYYALVVAAEPSYASLRRIVAKMAPGGWLYVEARRRFRPTRLTPSRRRRRTPGAIRAGAFGWALNEALDGSALPSHAPGYVAALRRLGLEEVAAHWHWPNLESCLEIVPLADRPAVLGSLSRRTGGRLARLKATLARGLLQAGLLARLVPYFSVLGRVGQGLP